MLKIKRNYIFIFEIALFVLIVTGIVPRIYALALASILAFYIFRAPLEDAVLLFVQSIPLFIALPLTKTFDNFNTWRILSIIIFLRWFLHDFRLSTFDLKTFFRYHRQWHRNHPVATSVLTLLLLAGVSLIGAPHLKEGMKRIIYFVNLSLVGVVLYDLTRNAKLKTQSLIQSIAIPTIIVVVVGYIQLVSTYLMNIYQFMQVWGENIQLNQFGSQWSYIAVWKGNTWFAYYGSQLSLRVFSLFPDSHSFPVFVLLGLPALFALGLNRPALWEALRNFKQLIRTRANLSIAWIPIAFLILILTGTRGIWAASVPTAGLAVLLVWWLEQRRNPIRYNLFRYLSAYLILFFMLFALAYPIFVSPQFLLSKGDWGLFGNRIASIIDFGETSNAQRILIWKQSIRSIVHHPLLGVGIGNFPVVLAQDIQLARAGSSAHNIYLHIAAEMGIPALLGALWFLWQLYHAIYKNYFTSSGMAMTYFGALLICIPWVFAYLMTDPVLFDERVFLLFATTAGLIFAKHE